MVDKADQHLRSRTVLLNHPSLSQLPLQGLPAFFFGISFASAGLLVWFSATGVIGKGPSSGDAPAWVLQVVSFMFILPGSLITLHGVRAFFRTRRLRGGLSRRIYQPWVVDHAWNHRQATYWGLRQTFSGLMFSLFCMAALAIVLWLLTAANEVGFARYVLLFSLSILGLMVLGGWIWTLRTLFRAIKYRRGILKFNRFPFMTGEKLEVRFVLPKALRKFERMRFTLHLVEETFETTGKDRIDQVVCYQLYKDEKSLTQEQVHGSEVPLAFDLPKDLPGNSLIKRPPTYWQLMVNGETPGIDYKALFLLPIYTYPS